jgi:outer membrane protein OmpA-like peptidoglycan-associated protein
MFNLGADAEFRVARLFKNKLSLLVGATLNGTFHRGGQNTGGSYLNGIELGPSLTADWMNAYPSSWKVFGPSRLTIQGGLIAGSGNTTAGDNFSLDKTSGAGGFVRGAIDLIGFHINHSGDTLNLGLWGETGAIPHARGDANYPYLAGGLEVSMALRWPGASRTKTVEICSSSQSAIEDLMRDLPQLRSAVGDSYSNFQTLSGVLQQKGYDSDAVRKYLRAGKIEQLKAQEQAKVEADGKAAGKKDDEIKKDVAASLKAKEKDFLAQAELEYPDGYDYYDVKLPNQANIPNKVPTDCNAVEDLRKQLEDEKAALTKTQQVLFDKLQFMLMVLGVPKGATTTVVKLIRSVTRIRDVHFITNAPGSTNDPDLKTKATKATIEYLDGLATAYLSANAADANGARTPTAMPDMMDKFSSIFPSSYKQDATTKFSPALDAIAEVASTFRSPDMKGFKVYILGNTDSRGPADYNQRLSLRRAQAIRDALVLQGVNPDMLVPIGRGKTNLIYFYDQRSGRDPNVVKGAEVRELAANGIRGSALNDEIFGRQVTNRRVEVLVCAPNSDDTVCQGLEKETAPAGATTQPTGSPATAPVENIETTKSSKRKTSTKVTTPPPPPPPDTSATKTPPPPPPPPPDPGIK